MLTCQTAVWLCLATADDDDFADDDDDDDFDGENEDGFVDYGPANDGGGSGDAPGGDGFNDGSGNDHGFNIDDAHEPHVMSGLRFLGWGLLAATRGARHDDGFRWVRRPAVHQHRGDARDACFVPNPDSSGDEPGPRASHATTIGALWGARSSRDVCHHDWKEPQNAILFCGAAGLGGGSPVRTTRRGRPRPPSHRLGDTPRFDPNPHSPVVPSRTPARTQS